MRYYVYSEIVLQASRLTESYWFNDISPLEETVFPSVPESQVSSTMRDQEIIVEGMKRRTG